MKCTGLIFKGHVSLYESKERLVRREELRLLKRKSCKCIHCLYMREDIADCYTADHSVIWPVIEHNKLYSVRVTNETHDYESGIVDGYDYEFYEVRE